ncbi:MAG TPA: sugar phosphate isomerase/epimerase family protein [Pirellulales bacterium]|nr:sugar phosphate isomerase/epimerase family protein [Pirellulales bacterium]
MSRHFDRRQFLATSSVAAAGALLPVTRFAKGAAAKEPLYTISLAEWSLHKTLFGGKMNNLEFPAAAKNDYGIDAVEYVNQFFKDKAKDTAYLSELKQRAADLGVQNVLIMIDGEGSLGDPDEDKRKKAVENHYPWIEAAKFLGCHAIRVNAASKGSYEETQKLAADGLRRVSEFGRDHGINVIVENHGGLSSNGQWLVGVIKAVNLPNCGTLPDFGNFRVSATEMYDRYKGVTELMPFAKAVSAKSHDFDEQGNETKTDYKKMMKIVIDAGYHGRVGIEYEGAKLSEPDGIKATKKLLERVRDELAG